MVAGILREDPDVRNWLMSKAAHLPHGQVEVETIMKQLERKDFIWTTSCGRLLDAVSAILGISYERTYEGEPAMKLETNASLGRDLLNLAPEIDGEKIITKNLVHAVFDNRDRMRSEDLAHSAQAYIARALATVAMEIAEREGIKAIGFSGGVALNEQIALSIRKMVSDSGLQYYANTAVPPGDGGLSLGQAYLASIE
jgi:hydrogenase maturation protein HypF